MVADNGKPVSLTRKRIIDAATEVIQRRGLANTTTKQIAQTAGYSEATLYKHFQDKQDIFLCVMRERLPVEFIRTLAGLVERAGRATVRANLIDVATRAVSFYRQSIPIMNAVFATPGLLARHREALHRTNQGPHMANVAVAEYLGAEQRLGRIRATRHPEALAALLIGACFQRAFLTLFVGEHAVPAPVEEFAEQIVDDLLTSESF